MERAGEPLILGASLSVLAGTYKHVDLDSQKHLKTVFCSSKTQRQSDSPIEVRSETLPCEHF